MHCIERESVKDVESIGTDQRVGCGPRSILGEIPIAVPWAEKWCVEPSVRDGRGRWNPPDVKSERVEGVLEYFLECAQENSLDSSFRLAGMITTWRQHSLQT